MPEESQPRPFFDYARHREQWHRTREVLERGDQPAQFTVRASAEVLHDYLKEARVRTHRFRSDEAGPGGGDEAPNPLGYFVADVGF